MTTISKPPIATQPLGDKDTGSLSFGFHALSGAYKAKKSLTVNNNDATAKTYTASWTFRDRVTAG